jgi:hypothetical protein
VHGEADEPVSVTVRGSGDWVRVEVENHGSINRHVRDQLFRRFVSTRIDKGGSGLGLAIVRAVAEAHGGTVSLEQTGPPRVVFRLSLPSARSVGTREANTMAGAVALGSCLGTADLHKTLGIVKAYTTRVGSGPFPTELFDETGEFLQTQGGEIGTVTGRSRRCGWLDAALIRGPIMISSVKSIVLTKLDVLDSFEKIKICVAYDIDGKTYDHMPSEIDLQAKIKPIYEEVDGWKSKTAGAKSIDELPKNALNYIKRIEELCGVKVEYISTGAKREETIVV